MRMKTLVDTTAKKLSAYFLKIHLTHAQQIQLHQRAKHTVFKRMIIAQCELKSWKFARYLQEQELRAISDYMMTGPA